MEDYDFEKIDRGVTGKITWVEIEDYEPDSCTCSALAASGGIPPCTFCENSSKEEGDLRDIGIAEVQRANEIANFGKEGVQLPLSDWNPPVELLDTRPGQLELIPVGLYDGRKLLLDTIILDDSYIVYIQMPNSEHNCEVIIS